MKKNCVLLCMIVLAFADAPLLAQRRSDTTAPAASPGQINRFVQRLSTKLAKVDALLTRQTRKALRRFERQEARLQRLLARKDSTTAAVFAGTANGLQRLRRQYEQPDTSQPALPGQYNACTDTLRNTLAYLQQHSTAGPAAHRLLNATGQLQTVEARLQQATAIRQYLRDRKAALRQQLDRFGLGHKIKRLDKAQYYYGQYVQGYKDLLAHPQKAQQQLLALLRKTRPWQDFVARHSLLAQWFALPGTAAPATAASLAGLQTRQSVLSGIATSLGLAALSPGAQQNALQVVQSRVQSGMQQVSALQQRVQQYGNADGDMPSFRPSAYKTRSLLQRIEWGANVQFGKTNRLLPTTADIGLSLGYKLPIGAIGMGLSYKLGMGSDWRKPRFTSNGLGLRSYIDLRLKGQLLLSGGYEREYLHGFSRLSVLRDQQLWQQSGLIGLSRKIPLRGNKMAKLSLLWDFLSGEVRPQRQPVVLRMGWSN